MTYYYCNDYYCSITGANIWQSGAVALIEPSKQCMVLCPNTNFGSIIKMSDLKTSTYDFSAIPFDDLTSVGQRTLLHRDIFTVSWLLGRFCNYRCSYCWPYARSDRKDHRPTELCLKTIDSIKEQARANGFNSFHFSLSGGESFHHYLDILHLLVMLIIPNYTKPYDK